MTVAEISACSPGCRQARTEPNRCQCGNCGGSAHGVARTSGGPAERFMKAAWCSSCGGATLHRPGATAPHKPMCDRCGSVHPDPAPNPSGSHSQPEGAPDDRTT